MTEIKVKTRNWGNSIGVTLPKDVIQSENICVGEEIRIEIKKAAKKPAQDFFGSLKLWKINTQELKKKLAQESDW